MSNSYFHPLTDEIIDTFASPQYDSFEGIGDVNCGFTYDDLRAAADWQLEQVINWIRCSPWVGSDCPIYDFEDEQDRLQLIADIKKSMRPTTTQENN
jgi:hypothetical protein